MEDAGVAAVVLPSLFEEQLRLDSEALDADLSRGAEEFAEATSCLPNLSSYNAGPDGYLELIAEAKRSVAIPVIASLNGITPGGWVRDALDMQAAGADAIELNLYLIETDPRRSAMDVERDYCELVRRVKASVRIPLAVKLSPFLSSIPHMAVQLDQAGADALVLFNRFYRPQIQRPSRVATTCVFSVPTHCECGADGEWESRGFRTNPNCKEYDLFEIRRSHLGNPGVVVGSEAHFLLQGMNLPLNFRHLVA